MNETNASLQQMRILCADDNVHVGSLLRETLRARGYNVEIAIDGQQALTTLSAQPAAFDLLIADFRMPRLNGYELAKAARDAGFRGEIIIFASPLTDEETQQLRAIPVHAIFEKPASRQQLLACIEKIAHARRATVSRDHVAPQDRQSALTEQSVSD